MQTWPNLDHSNNWFIISFDYASITAIPLFNTAYALLVSEFNAKCLALSVIVSIILSVFPSITRMESLHTK